MIDFLYLAMSCVSWYFDMKVNEQFNDCWRTTIDMFRYPSWRNVPINVPVKCNGQKSRDVSRKFSAVLLREDAS